MTHQPLVSQPTSRNIRLFSFVILNLVVGVTGGCMRGVGSPKQDLPAGQDEHNLQSSPPMVPRNIVEESIGDVHVTDPYRWMEDPSSPQVRAWMNDQDTYARQSLRALPGRDLVASRLKSLIYRDERSAPIVFSGRLFFWRRKENEEKTVFYWQQGVRGSPNVLLNPNKMSADGSIGVDRIYPSRDGKLVIYTETLNNQDVVNLKVLDVDTLKTIESDTIRNILNPNPAWAQDGKGFFYNWNPDDKSVSLNDRYKRTEIRYHKLGTNPDQDTLVMPSELAPTALKRSQISPDGRYLLVTATMGPMSEQVFLKRLDSGSSTFLPLTTGQSANRIVCYNDSLYRLTNDGAPQFRILSANINDSTIRWREIVPEDKEVVLQDIDIMGKHLVIKVMRNASYEVDIRALDGKLVRKIQLPSIGTVSDIEGSADRDIAYYTFESFNRPKEVFATSISTGETKAFARTSIPVNADSIRIEQVFYKSKDGTQVPMFLAYRKDMRRDGQVPTLMTGYGAWGLPWDPYFSPRLYLWIEMGGLLVFTSIRGGGEFGEQWHVDGMLDKKQNGFDDFIAGAEWLVAQKYTDPRHLAVWGGSFGGILAGAVLTQRPDLFKTVTFTVPVIDMLRYHVSAQGAFWKSEFGDPANPKCAKWLLSYSPYHRLKEGVTYPPILVMSSDSDDRVDPMHARKFVAAMQYIQKGRAPALLRIEKNAGHSGADLRRADLEARTDELTFIASQLGLRIDNR